MSTYIVITSQLVGGEAVPMEIAHFWDGRTFFRKDEAISHGFKQRGSDDFNVGQVDRSGVLESIWWMDERVDEPPEIVRDISREVGLK